MLPLIIKEKEKAKWQEAQIYRNPGFFSACSVSLLLVTHLTELTVAYFCFHRVLQFQLSDMQTYIFRVRFQLQGNNFSVYIKML